MSSDEECEESRRKIPVSRSCIGGGIVFDGCVADQLSLFYSVYLKECSEGDAALPCRLSIDAACDESRCKIPVSRSCISGVIVFDGYASDQSTL